MTHIALFRGINVGGKNILPMKALRSLLESLGAAAVRTYIQSGNVLFEGKEDGSWSEKITEAVQEHHGFSPQVLLLSLADLEKVIAQNPYPEAVADPKRLQVGFLAAAPTAPNLEKLETLRIDSERCAIIGKAFYLHAPDGIGKSKIAAGAEKAIGVPMTVRNWNTVLQIRALAETG
ncbi:DUF1697 domain-containing protein [Cerasicoccus frondis]|uniref:DUF1697 domain-containing protein n=1 Tax=Cerasicoccus frondis TaxID=490090 RepID=UPI0028527EAE|nr:DUF1697 domain-containing protein [Cerasicoccus frondis]